MYKIHSITIFDNQTMTESIRTMDRANWKPNSIHYINPSNSKNEIDIEIHTWIINRQLGYDILELTKAVANSTFLNTIEPVVFIFF